MKFYKLILLLVPVISLSACGDGHDYADEYYEETYIDWAGSVNGTIVVDATDDAFEFEIHTGYLHFGHTTYTNAWIDAYGDFYIDGIQIGGVYYVESIGHETITALVSNDGFYIDLYGPESDLAWSEADTTPIYALKNITAIDQQGQQAIYTQSARLAATKTAPQATPPHAKSNAYTEDNLPVNNQSTLSQ